MRVYAWVYAWVVWGWRWREVCEEGESLGAGAGGSLCMLEEGERLVLHVEGVRRVVAIELRFGRLRRAFEMAL